MMQLKEWNGKVTNQTEIQWSFYKSSIGFCLVAWVEKGICWVCLHPTKSHKKEALLDLSNRFPEAKLRELKSCPYKGDLDLLLKNRKCKNKITFYLKGTPFQVQVWKQLFKVPPSTTTTYKELAEKVGSPKAFRAVGTAVGANPIAVMIPCHRVLRTDKGIGGFRWGLAAKRKLLAAEGLVNI